MIIKHVYNDDDPKGSEAEIKTKNWARGVRDYWEKGVFQLEVVCNSTVSAKQKVGKDADKLIKAMENATKQCDKVTKMIVKLANEAKL